MASYTVQSPAGQSVTIEGDSPPTEKDLDEIFAKVAPANAPAPVVAPSEQNFSQSWQNPGAPSAGPRNPRTGLPDLRHTDQFGHTIDAVLTPGATGGGAAVGASVGAFGGPIAPATIPIGAAIGGAIGNYFAQKARVAMGEANAVKPGEVAGSAAMGLIPGGGGILAQGLKGGVGNLVAKTIETGVDEDRLPTWPEVATSMFMGGGGGMLGAKLAGKPRLAPLTPEEALMAGRDKAYRDVRPYKIVVPPSDVGKGSDTLGSMGGAAATRYAAIVKNQPGYQQMTREDLGLSGAGPITGAEYKALRDAAAEPYQKIAQISEAAQARLDQIEAAGPKAIDGPSTAAKGDYDKSLRAVTDPLLIQAKANVQQLPMARIAAHQAYVDMKNQVQGATYEAWQAKKAIADQMENDIEAAAAVAGDKTLLPRLQASRRLIAKSYVAQAATNPDNGLVSPKTFGDISWEAGTRGMPSPLDGNFQKMAAFYNNFDRLGKDVTSVPAPGVNAMTMGQSLNSAANGGLLSKAIGFAQSKMGGPARAYQLSEFAQNRYAAPRLDTRPTAKSFAAQLARYGAMTAGR